MEDKTNVLYLNKKDEENSKKDTEKTEDIISNLNFLLGEAKIAKEKKDRIEHINDILEIINDEKNYELLKVHIDDLDNFRSVIRALGTYDQSFENQTKFQMAFDSALGLIK